MAISATCPGCGKRISGPDSAAGHKAKCPKCGQIITFPESESAGGMGQAGKANKAGRSSTADLARALARGAGAAPAAPPEEPEPGAAAAEPAAVSTPTPGRGATPSRRSSTTLSRMLARSSPYKTLRLLGVILYGIGIAVSVLTFLGGLAALILLAMSGQPGPAVGVFIAALVAAAVVLIGAKAGSELMRLLADVGDRTRQMTLLLENRFAQDHANDL